MRWTTSMWKVNIQAHQDHDPPFAINPTSTFTPKKPVKNVCRLIPDNIPNQSSNAEKACVESLTPDSVCNATWSGPLDYGTAHQTLIPQIPSFFKTLTYRRKFSLRPRSASHDFASMASENVENPATAPVVEPVVASPLAAAADAEPVVPHMEVVSICLETI